ncbi:three-helix bundle dimerization domain-containing protein [Kitasatospora paranensis]|uniref:Three-helix bundle dimerization domain-containing protein n=1 Tax=Kitasatospora paranensis TaxID=258053 RepID=A0ABW2FPE9_9ACTN
MEDQESLRAATRASALREAEHRLHRRFDATTGPAAVTKAVAEARSHFDGSRVLAFIPILVERRATDTLDRLNEPRQDRTAPEPDSSAG